uniref:VWFA domain-containing protein n=1 Tax=Elaeophora elaphi TaxID=1147741 RepID=A0A158Q8Q4_9BILA
LNLNINFAYLGGEKVQQVVSFILLAITLFCFGGQFQKKKKFSGSEEAIIDGEDTSLPVGMSYEEIFALLFLAVAVNAQVSKKAQCKRGTLDVIFLVDTNDFNNTTDFNKQQNRIIDIIRWAIWVTNTYLENKSVDRDISYGIIEFHRYPVILLPITSPFASRPKKVVDYIKTLEARTKFASSPARALESAAQEFISSDHTRSSKLVILAHDGVSMDLIAETLEAKDSLERIGAKLFAITSTTEPNLPALIGYTTNRQYVYATESDRDIFYEELRKATDPCEHLSESLSGRSSANDTTLQAAIASRIRAHETKEAQSKEKLSLERVCKANKVDLTVVLDSSGSVFNAFEDERKLVHELIDSLVPTALEDGRIQVSIVRFASSAEVVIPAKISRIPNEIMDKLDKIKFTGGGTRIANAVDLALADLSNWRRDDAIQIFILISDGNGQELWHVAQTAGRKLQNANTEIFAVPISRDYNLDELTLYTGDAKRIYLWEEQNQFISTISSLINKCVRANLSQSHIIDVTKLEQDVFENESTTSVKSKAQILQENEEETSESLIAKTKPFSKTTSSNSAIFGNVLDDLNSSANAREQSLLKAKGTRLLATNKQSSKLDKDLKSELIINEATKQEQITAKISPQVGNFDLLFVIDLSPNSSSDLRNQLKLITELIANVADEDINEERIRVAVVTFTKEARLALEWGEATNKALILQHFGSINYIVGDSSAVTGITFATQYAEEFRRPNARLMIILVSDGSVQDLWYSILQAAKKLHALQETNIYAITTSKKYIFDELEAFTKDKWKVYVDGRTRRFVSDASKQFLPSFNEEVKSKELSTKDADENDKPIDSISSPIIESIQNHNDLVDLIILIDKSTAANDDFEASKIYLEDLLQSLQIGDSGSRIRISLITFTDKAQTEIELRKPTTKEDALYAVERLQNGFSNASVSEAVNVALQQISIRSENPRRYIFVIITDGSTQDSTQATTTAAAKLQQTGAEVYIIPITYNYSMSELLLYAGEQGTFITNVKGYRKKFPNYILLDSSSSVKKDFVDGTKTDQFFVGKATKLSRGKPFLLMHLIFISYHYLPLLKFEAFLGQLQVTNKPNLALKSTVKNETRRPPFHFDHPSAAINSEGQKEDSNCLVDLIFIMDTSQSVEKAFQKQLEFATALIKRIQPSAFTSRIRVAALSFSSQAQISFQFDQFNNRTEILNALLSLTHSGGNTSSVSGINLAINEIKKRGRKGVRRMIVLISDGHSQDRWENLLDAADRLRATNATVYAIAANHDYYFKELELYTRNKWLVYVDGREKRFLDDATVSLLQCQNPSAPISSLPPEVATSIFFRFNSLIGKKLNELQRKKKFKFRPYYNNAMVELAFFFCWTNCLLSHAMIDFQDRLAVAVVEFNDTGKVHFGFKKKQTPEDILYELERLEQAENSGSPSLAAGVEAALLEIALNRRPSARLVIVIFSSGNNQDTRQLTQNTALKLHKTGGEIYAMTKFKVDEITKYTGSVARVYVNDKVNNFTKKRSGNNKKEENHLNGRQKFITSSNFKNDTLNVNGKSEEQTRIAKSLELKRCKYSKMDLEIILDASTSRQQVFEHQRELALSLIERLPIDAGETHVAVGINSFTSVPTLRQTLGLGRDKQMVRHAIEGIKYNGGSTFTAQAVELSVQDLERGRRPDAIQVVVLMNDGMSQDPWKKVLEASQLLRATGAELFGVALGENIDLRELKHYIGNTDRIYRDNSTERFLTDVVSLLIGGENCSLPSSVSLENAKPSSSSFNDQICTTPNLDIVILFDNAIKMPNLSEQSISSNRYLLLDVLGSLPATKRDGRVTITVITFNNRPQLVVSMIDLKERDSIFTKVETIRPKTSKSSYANAINFALLEYNKGYREDAHGMLVIVGDGRSTDSVNERNSAIEHLRTAKALSIYAVDSGKSIDVDTLSKYTGSADNVFNYDRNAEFARLILDATEAANKARCIRVTIKEETTTTVRSTRNSRPIIESVNKKAITKEQNVLARNKVEKKNEAFLDGKDSKEKQLKEISKSSQKPTQQTTPTLSNFNFHRKITTTTASAPSTTTIFTPGCEIDAILIVDSSGSVEKTFNREKEIAAAVIDRLRIGPKNARVAIIKFAAEEKIKTIWSFEKSQEKEKVLQALQAIPFSSGTTAIHAALLQVYISGTPYYIARILQAIAEYSSEKGARPQVATPLVIIFTDGFTQKDTAEAATLLRNLIPNIFAVAVSSQHPVSKEELIKIAGSKDRVFMDDDVKKLFEMLEKITRTC